MNIGSWSSGANAGHYGIKRTRLFQVTRYPYVICRGALPDLMRRILYTLIMSCPWSRNLRCQDPRTRQIHFHSYNRLSSMLVHFCTTLTMFCLTTRLTVGIKALYSSEAAQAPLISSRLPAEHISRSACFNCTHRALPLFLYFYISDCRRIRLNHRIIKPLDHGTIGPTNPRSSDHATIGLPNHRNMMDHDHHQTIGL